MTSTLNPYINFKNTTREAMEFYQSAFGGELTMQTFKELGASKDESDADLIMHSMLIVDNGMKFMAADTPNHMEYKAGVNNFSISLSGDNEPELRGYFDKLSVGGNVVMPLQKAIWGDTFGWFTDKFGINWLVNISSSAS